jgi:hypothetical protein
MFLITIGPSSDKRRQLKKQRIAGAESETRRRQIATAG